MVCYSSEHHATRRFSTSLRANLRCRGSRGAGGGGGGVATVTLEYLLAPIAQIFSLSLVCFPVPLPLLHLPENSRWGQGPMRTPGPCAGTEGPYRTWHPHPWLLTRQAGAAKAKFLSRERKNLLGPSSRLCYLLAPPPGTSSSWEMRPFG